MSTRTACDVLIAAAHRVELVPLRAALGAGESVTRGGLRIAWAEVGVGIASAGAGMAAALARSPARGVVLLGSFGAYPGSSAAVGSVLVADQVLITDEALIAERSAAPAAMRVHAEADPALGDALRACAPGATRGALATVAFITTDDALAHTLGAGSGCAGENLEALAVALACEASAVAWASVLACTNEVGAKGRAQWLANHERAAHASTDVVLAWLDRGAPGLR